MTELLTEVKINGVDVVSKLLSYNIDETFGDDISTAVITLTKYVYDLITTLDNGMSITIKRGFTTKTDQFIFSGEITEIEKKGSQVVLHCKDLLLGLLKASVNYTFDGVSFPSTEKKGSDIATTLIETWGGMSASVVDTGDEIVFKKFICSDVDVFSRLKTLAEIYDYVIFYDADDGTVHFEPKGQVSSPDALFVGGDSGNVSNVPTWQFDNTQCVNKLKVLGAVQVVQDDEFFTGDASGIQVFTLSKIPIGVQVWEEVGGDLVLKVPGVESSTSGDYDYEISKENKTITTTTNWDPASAANNVKITYTNSIPVPVVTENLDSQTKYGIYESTKSFSDIQTVSDAEVRGNGFIATYGTPFVKVMVKPVNLIDYDVGNIVSVTDTINDESRSLVVNKVVKKYPYNGDEISLGDKEWRLSDWGQMTLDRIKRLEEENQKNIDFLITVKSFSKAIDAHIRYLEVDKRSPANSTALIYDNNRSYDNGFFYDGGFGPSTAIRITWPDDTYVEDFRTTDFKESGTGSWSTANRVLVFE